MVTMRLTGEQLLEWADPSKEAFYGYAFSEEHATEITAEVARRRQEFLSEAIHSQLNGVPDEARDPNDELDFSIIPLRSVLDRDEHLELAKQCWSTRRGGTSNPVELMSYWTKLAEIQARLDGHPIFTTKNSDFYVSTGNQRNPSWRKEHEKRLQCALDDATFIHNSGYPVRFLMTGAQYIRNAALDMDSVAAWVKYRDKKDYPTVFWTPRSFWPTMVEAKQAQNEAAGEKCYADVVTELLPGVSVAPYIDKQVDASPDYFHFDDIFHEAALEGFQEQIATRALRTIVKLLCDNPGQYSEIYEDYFGASTAARIRPGVLFFHVDILPEVLERAEDMGVKGKSIQLIENLEAKYCSLPDEYDELVFS